MKTIKYIAYTLSLAFLSSACEQELIDLKDPCDVDPAKCATFQTKCDAASPGTADFTKFVAVGSSYTAGFQAGALFKSGQDASLPQILSTAFACVGGGAFNQPTMASEYGYNIFVSPNPPADNQIRGRFLLQGTPPSPVPYKFALGDLSAAPNPAVNPGFMYTGSAGAIPSSQLNNFGVPAILLGQALIPQTGNWGDPNPAKGFNPFYARFASNPGTSTMLGDAVGSMINSGTFFLFWLGMDDVLLYAVFGGDPTKAPLTPVNAVSVENPGFKNLYNAAISPFLALPGKGVVANYPDIFSNPHFRAIPYNPIPLDAATAQQLKTNLADNYNLFLDGMVQNAIITTEEAAKRKIAFNAGQNPILINDETLTDLDPYMAGPYEGLKPYARARQTTNADIIPLAAGSVIGTGPNAQQIFGVSVPMADQYILIPTEITEINATLAEFNKHVKDVADANPEKLAFADVNKAILEFAAKGSQVQDDVNIAYTLAPPFGIYSEDLLHPNSRGYAFIAKVIIDAINSKFGSTIPAPPLGNYSGTALPINP